MSLKKRFEETTVDKKIIKAVEKEKDPYVELKMKIQAQVIQDLDIDFNEISEQNEALKQDDRWQGANKNMIYFDRGKSYLKLNQCKEALADFQRVKKQKNHVDFSDTG